MPHQAMNPVGPSGSTDLLLSRAVALPSGCRVRICRVVAPKVTVRSLHAIISMLKPWRAGHCPAKQDRRSVDRHTIS